MQVDMTHASWKRIGAITVIAAAAIVLIGVSGSNSKRHAGQLSGSDRSDAVDDLGPGRTVAVPDPGPVRDSVDVSIELVVKDRLGNRLSGARVVCERPGRLDSVSVGAFDGTPLLLNVRP